MMRNKLIVGLTVFALLLFFIPKVEAANGQLYLVDSEKLMVRTSADPHGEIVAQLHKGDKVTVFQHQFGWGRTFYKGHEAWVALHHLILVDPKKGTVKKHRQPVKEDHTRNKKIDKKSQKEKLKHEGKTEKKERFDDVHDLYPIESGNSFQPSKSEQWQKEVAPDRKLSSAVTIQRKGKLSLSGYHFVIDPGHGGKDPGTQGANVLEKFLTLNTAKQVAENLQQKGADVTMTRTNDSFISLEKRVQISHAHQTDAFISLHFNSNPDSDVGGLNTFYYKDGKNAQFAKKLQTTLIQHMKLVDRGARKADYYVLRNNKNLAILIELGFLSNPQERKKVQTKTFQQQAAEGISAGLADYFKKGNK